VTYRWHIDVKKYNLYGDRVESTTPMTVLAETKAEVTTKVNAAFGATYDDFRKFWSHGWVLKSVEEEATAIKAHLLDGGDRG